MHRDDERALRGHPAASAALRPRRRIPSPTRAAVLFLHGGRADSSAPSHPWHLAALRMEPFVRAVAAALPDDEVALASVRYRVRGWNGDAADPLQDTHRAIEELTRRVGEVPVVLVGHSMGARAGLRAAAHPHVGAVLALAPWCPAGEPVAHLAGKDVIVLHGDHDRVTDPDASAAFVHRARAAGATADMIRVSGGDHAMLRNSGRWHRMTVSGVRRLLTR
ncbi:alpha/beta fold hydrolase [Streptomyces sp. NPDC049813]|uniref:alpha/beta fold hydrolase n=1 Tax=Streptomyces sp. NPDC049813 TaxID=3365597 RepID=UPI0037B97AC5